jgi:hypothetical protein
MSALCCFSLFLSLCPRAGGIAAAPRMDGKFIGIDAFFVLEAVPKLQFLEQLP